MCEIRSIKLYSKLCFYQNKQRVLLQIQWELYPPLNFDTGRRILRRWSLSCLEYWFLINLKYHLKILTICCIITKIAAGVAQLVEHLTRNEKVTCSSHATSSITFFERTSLIDIVSIRDVWFIHRSKPLILLTCNLTYINNFYCG